MSRKYSQHTVSPLRFDGLEFPPASQGWSSEQPPENMSVKRIKCLRLSDGTSKIFRLLTHKKISKQEQAVLRQRAAAKLAEVQHDNVVAIVRKERKFLKTAPRMLPAKVLKRRRRRAAKQTS